MIGSIKNDCTHVGIASGTGRFKGSLYFFDLDHSKMEHTEDPRDCSPGDVVWIQEWFLQIPSSKLVTVMWPGFQDRLKK
jgi:hypothetical protein